MPSEHHHHWFSPATNSNIHVLSFGDRGFPIILFPTSMGRYYDAKDQGLMARAAWFLDQGLVKIYCVDSIDVMSWYNRDIHPSERAQAHRQYDQMILEELIPFCQADTHVKRVGVAGCSFGGYHAVNFAFRHPTVVKYVISMGGTYDIKFLLDGYYDDHVYFNNPLDFLPDAQSDFFKDMYVFLGVGRRDICWNSNEKLAAILRHKKIPHWLDARDGSTHDWPTWLEMFPHYLSLINSPQLF